MKSFALAIALFVPLGAVGKVPTLKLLQGVAARDVEDREPVGVAKAFPANVGRVTVFVRIENPGASTTVTLVWRHEGTERLRTELAIGHSKRWRSWGRKRIRPADVGRWAVEVLSVEGGSVGTISFEVGAGEVKK